MALALMLMLMAVLVLVLVQMQRLARQLRPAYAGAWRWPGCAPGRCCSPAG
jgi:hypothetical protein